MAESWEEELQTLLPTQTSLTQKIFEEFDDLNQLALTIVKQYCPCCGRAQLFERFSGSSIEEILKEIKTVIWQEEGNEIPLGAQLLIWKWLKTEKAVGMFSHVCSCSKKPRESKEESDDGVSKSRGLARPPLWCPPPAKPGFALALKSGLSAPRPSSAFKRPRPSSAFQKQR